MTVLAKPEPPASTVDGLVEVGLSRLQCDSDGHTVVTRRNVEGFMASNNSSMMGGWTDAS